MNLNLTRPNVAIVLLLCGDVALLVVVVIGWSLDWPSSASPQPLGGGPIWLGNLVYAQFVLTAGLLVATVLSVRSWMARPNETTPLNAVITVIGCIAAFVLGGFGLLFLLRM